MKSRLILLAACCAVASAAQNLPHAAAAHLSQPLVSDLVGVNPPRLAQLDLGGVNPPRLAQLDLGGVNPPRLG